MASRAGLTSVCALHHQVMTPLLDLIFHKPSSLTSWRGRNLVPTAQKRSNSVESASWRQAGTSTAKCRKESAVQASKQGALV